MKASDVLPFTFAMGLLTLLFYYVTGDVIFIGQNIAYLSVSVLLFIIWVIDGRLEKAQR